MTQQENVGKTADVNVQQVMMTLAGLASTAQNPLPGESTSQQTARIQAGIEAQLAMPTLATAGQWTLRWVGQSGDGANMVYIAQNTAATALAVVFRGTVNLLNLMEDDDVGTLEDFNGGASYGKVSRGSNAAFSETAKGTELVSTLQGLVKASPETQTVYVVGHSLGGAMATMFSLYLRDQLSGYSGTVQCYTFAAPSAGDSTFATSFNNQTPSPVCVWNAYDVVPHAWAALETVRDTFYPSPGPACSKDLKQQLQDKINKANGQYTQTAQQTSLNQDFSTNFSDARRIPRNDSAMADAYWQEELGFQHAANTYLGLLGLSQQQVLPLAPAVTGLSPNNGHTNDLLTITGNNFSKDCSVKFFFLVGAGEATDVTVQNETIITCKAPLGMGAADVRVINCAGASDHSDATQFKYDASGA